MGTEGSGDAAGAVCAGGIAGGLVVVGVAAGTNRPEEFRAANMGVTTQTLPTKFIAPGIIQNLLGTKWKFIAERITSIEDRAGNFRDAEMAKVPTFEYLEYFETRSVHITDKGISALKNNRGLRNIVILNEPHLTGNCLFDLGSIKGLERLLIEAPLDSLEGLRGHQQLRILDLGYTHLRDEDLYVILTLPHLYDLQLEGCVQGNGSHYDGRYRSAFTDEAFKIVSGHSHYANFVLSRSISPAMV